MIYSLKLNRDKHDLWMLFVLTFFSVYEALNSTNIVSIAVLPVLYALFSVWLGYRKIRLKNKEGLAVILINMIFAALFWKSGLIMLNLFLIAFVLWSAITPFLSKYKGYMILSVIVALALSFLIPFHVVHMPLFIFLYYPFYILGFELDRIKIKHSVPSIIAVVIALLVSASVISGVYLGVLAKDYSTELRFIYDFYNNKSIFVYSPIIVLCFLILISSAVDLLWSNVKIKEFMKRDNTNLRAMSAAFTVLVPVLYLLSYIKFNTFFAVAAALILAIFYMVVYIRLNIILRKSEILNLKSRCKARISLTQIIIKALFIIGFAFVQVALVEFVLRGNSIEELLKCFSTVAFAYNVLFVLMMYTAISALLGIHLGSVLMIILNVFLVVANLIKVKFFNEPFYLWDTFLIKDAVIISKNYVSGKAIVALIIVSLLLIALLIKNLKRVLLFLKPHPNFLLLIAAVSILFYNMYQIDIFGFASVNICKTWEDSIDEFINNGVYVENYIYLKNISKYLNVKPDDYSKEKIEAIINESTPAVTVNAKLNSEVSNAKLEQQPNVIVILQESFWDPSNLPNVEFNKPVNTNLKQYQNATFISPVFGGGTANVEFEVLTGLSNFFFNKGVISYDVYVSHNIMALPQVFKENGYATTAIHPNTGEMYNRSKVYSFLGFEKFIDINGFNYAQDKKGSFVSDDKFADKIIDTLNDSSDSKPKFIMGVSIQNHDSYDSASKDYGDTEIKATSDKLNNQEKDILDNYSQGIYDGDKEIGKVIDAAAKSSRPTLVYVFGDHLPRLGYPLNNYDIYNKTGFLDENSIPENNIKMFETPVVRWASYKELPVIDSPISPNLLGYEILKDSGVSYPAYFDYLKTVGDKYPYLNNNLQNKTQLLQDDVLKNYYLIQYDLLFGKQYAAQNQ